MARTRIGLDIGSTAVRIAEVVVGERPEVTRLGQVPLPAGAVEDGEIREVAPVAAALDRLIDISGVKPGPVYLGFASSKVLVREVSLPWLSEKELRGALGFQVAEYIPMDPDDAVLDFQTISEGDANDLQRERRILLVAAQKTAVLASIAAAQAVGLDPVEVDLAPFAAVRATAEEADEQEALVDIGGFLTSVVLHRGTTVDLVRILATGGAEITSRISGDLGLDLATAELLKRGDADPSVAPEIQRTSVRETALRAASRLVDEIASTIEFSLRQTGGQIQRIVLTGGGSHLEGIVDLLGERVPGVVVERAKIFGRARSRLAPELGAMVEAGRAFSVAIGLALLDERSSAPSVSGAGSLTRRLRRRSA